MKEPSELADQYRALAAELRALAPKIKLPQNRSEILVLAEKYEKLAKRLEH